MKKKRETEPKQKCFDCEHYRACSAWNVGTLQNADATNCANYEPSMVLVRLELDRAKAEIERLQYDLDIWRDIAKRETSYVSIAKNEAIKEFAERLEGKTHNYYPSIDSYCVSRKVVLIADIDNLVKEMTGESNGNGNSSGFGCNESCNTHICGN